MQVKDIVFRYEIHDLEEDRTLRKLLRRFLAAFDQRRYAEHGEVSAEELEELGRNDRAVGSAKLLAWTRHRPKNHSTLILAPGALRVQLPGAKRGEDIAGFLRRVTDQIEAS